MITVVKLKNNSPLFIINLGKTPPASVQERFLARVNEEVSSKIKGWNPDALTFFHFDNVDITIVDREPI